MSVAPTRSTRSAQLRRLTAKSGEHPSLAFGAGVVAAAVAIILLHWLQAVGLGSGNTVLAALPVGVAVILAVGCWALLLWLFLQTRVDESQPGYILATVVSVVTIFVGLEAFAGLGTLLWQRGVIRSATSNAPSLWRAEGHYLWNLLNSVPLLAVPKTMGWRDPQPFLDHISGALLLAFKIALIGPLVRLGLSGYQFFESRRVQAMAKRESRAQSLLAGKEKTKQPVPHWLLPSHSSTSDVWRFLIGLIVALIAVAVAVVVLFDPESAVNRWISKLLRPGITIGNVHVALRWLDIAPQWVVLVALIVTIGYFIRNIGYTSAAPDDVGSIPVAIGATLVYFWLLALLTLTAAVASLALLHVGVAVAGPQIPLGSQPLAAVNAYAWAIADALPGPNIPTTLKWTLQYRFVDHWSEALLLLYKVAFLAVLLFPLYRIVRICVERSRPANAPEPLLPAARQFFDLLRSAQAELDKLENTEPYPMGSGFVLYLKPQGLFDALDVGLDNVRTLFGDIDVTRRANAAEAAVYYRYEGITNSSIIKSTVAEQRVMLDRRILEFGQSLNKALRDYEVPLRRRVDDPHQQSGLAYPASQSWHYGVELGLDPKGKWAAPPSP
jgi:hypothetical protein